MKNDKKLVLFTLLILLTSLILSHTSRKKVILDIPKDWPTPHFDFEASPLIYEQIELGRSLFYDPILSADSSVSCSSCHLSYTAFTHVDHALSHGIHDSIGKRNSPVLINLAWNTSFMWDGSVNHIEVQGLAPITNPLEMGESLENVLQKLNRSSTYRSKFFDAFDDSTITTAPLLKALAQFQLTLLSKDSKYDKVIRKEETFTIQEKKGYQLFQKQCNSCHTEPLFTSGGFENNGLQPDPVLNDPGRSGVTHRPADSLLFKVPTLRNLNYSFPYMHDGRYASLRDVLHHYTDSIHVSPTLSKALQDKIELSEEDKTDLLAFLLTLTDTSFLFNPNYAFPRKK